MVGILLFLKLNKFHKNINKLDTIYKELQVTSIVALLIIILYLTKLYRPCLWSNSSEQSGE